MFNNRYVQLSLLTLGIATLIYILLYLVFMALGTSLPNGLMLMVSALTAGYIVYQYFAQRIG
ncbi:MAG TPA: hypothetical protein VNI82_00650 [Candidatus Nitrosotenuis sp.]|nr:hypothetical protein [Candidatus Nitrosotenuis sp.]